MRSLNGLGRWGGVVGVVVVGVFASSLALRGARAGNPGKVLPKAAAVTSPTARVDRFIAGPGIPKIADLEVLPPITVDYRVDPPPPVGDHPSVRRGVLLESGFGTIAAGDACTYPFECDDCNPCTLDECADAACVGGDNDGYPCEIDANCEGVCDGGATPGEHCFTDIDCCGADPESHGTCDYYPCTSKGFDHCINALLPRRCDDGDRVERNCDCPGGACTGLVCVGGTRDTEACTCPGGNCVPGYEPDSECDDGFECNGPETCDAGVCQAGAPLCEAGERCNEADNSCLPPCLTATEGDECEIDGLACTIDKCDPKTCVGGTVNPDGECRDDTDCCIAGDCGTDPDPGTCTGGGTGECYVEDPPCGPGGCQEPLREGGPIRCSDGRCCDGDTCSEESFAECGTVPGDWLAMDQACIVLASGNPNICPLYGGGIAPQGTYVVEVGPVSNSDCAIAQLGDDYEVKGQDYIDLQLLRFVTAVQSSIRYQIEFWDVSGANPILIEDVFFPDGTNRGTSDMAVITIDFAPPLTIPASGVVSFSVQTNFGPNGSASWMSTDAADVGNNMADRMFVNGEMVTDFLGQCSGGGRDEQWCNRHDVDDLAQGCPGGGICVDVPDILAFELVATKSDIPLGACCITDTGECAQKLPWICESEGNSFQEVGQGCNVCSNDPFNLNCRAGEDGDCWKCSGGENDETLCCPGNPPGVCSGVNGTCDGGDRIGEECCPSGDCDITPQCLQLPPACELTACCNADTGECLQRPLCIGGLEDGRGCVNPVDLTRCEDGGGTCEIGCPGVSVSQGFGTTCDPDCCVQADLETGGDNCNLVDVQVINVPTVGSPPVWLTLTGNNSSATFDDYPDHCERSFLDPNSGTQDPGWWEAFSITACADVRVQLCCSDRETQPVRPAWGNLYFGCPCEGILGNSGAEPPIGEGAGTPGFARGGPFCDDDNLWQTYASLAKGIYYYPIYSAPDGTYAQVQGGGQYQLNIVVGACPLAACCLSTATCVGDGTFNEGEPCDDNLDCCAVEVKGECQDDVPGRCASDCAELDELDCDEAGGFWLAGENIPIGGNPVITCAVAPCDIGSCCSGPGACEDRRVVGVDCDLLNPDTCMSKKDCTGTYIGGPQCTYREPPCPVCTVDPEAGCYDSGSNLTGFVVVDQADLSNNSGPIADDFIATGNGISQLCFTAIIADNSLGTCSPDVAPSDAWEVKFYDDNNGIPGVLLPDSPVEGEVVTLSGKENLTFPGTDQTDAWYSYSVTFDPPISVIAGERYWLEIAGRGASDGSCRVWMISSTDGNQWSFKENDTDSGWSQEDMWGLPLDFMFCLDTGDGGFDTPPVATGACCECNGDCTDDPPVEWQDCIGGLDLYTLNGEDDFFPIGEDLGEWALNTSCLAVNCQERGSAGGCPGAPARGEDCVLPKPVTDGVHHFSNVCSSTDGHTNYSNCDTGPSGVGNDLWFEYTATCTGFVSIDVCGDTDFDHVLAIFQQRVDKQCPNLLGQPVCPPPITDLWGHECIDSVCTNHPAPTVTANVFPGDCFLISIGGWSDPDNPGAPAEGEGVLEIECEEACFSSNPPIPEPLRPKDPEGEDGEVNTKNRFLSITTHAADAEKKKAFRVTFVNLPPPFDIWNDEVFFAGEPREVCENSGKGLETDPDDCPAALPTDTFWAAPLLCEKDKADAHFMDWHGWCNVDTCIGGLKPGTACVTDDDCVEYVHLYHEGIVPTVFGVKEATYEIRVVDETCKDDLQDPASYSDPLIMIQNRWGDICGPGPGGACKGVADGVVDVTNDVLGVLDKFANVNNLQKARADLEPNLLDFKINVAMDVLHCLAAFGGAPYPFAPKQAHPCNALKVSRAGR